MINYMQGISVLLKIAFLEFPDDEQEHDQLNEGVELCRSFWIIGEENNKRLTDDIS